MVRHNGQHGLLEREWSGITVSTTGWKSVRRGRHNCQHGRFEWGARVVRHNGQHGWLKESVEDPVGRELGGAGITVSTAGWSGVRIVRDNGQHRRFVWSYDGPA